MNKIFVYYHVYLMGNWLDIVKDQIQKLQKYGLYDNAHIKVGILHELNNFKEQVELAKEFFKKYNKIEILFIKENTGFGESETISLLKKDCDIFTENKNILYIHAKGVTQYKTEKELPVLKWREMMEYFLIKNWKDCILKLNTGYDCCGINYQIHAGNVGGSVKQIYIFNGNFFWTNSDYVKKLNEKQLYEHRYSAENWIGSIQHKAYSFYNSPIEINLYYEFNNQYRK
jgi:hypothetical protein